MKQQLVHNPEYHRRKKHIRITDFFVRELIREGATKVRKIAIEFQVADRMKKVMCKSRLRTLCEKWTKGRSAGLNKMFNEVRCLKKIIALLVYLCIL